MTSSELITDEDLTSVAESAATLLATLNDHLNTKITSSHGNVTVLEEPVYDNSATPFDDSPDSPTGNRVGHVTLLVKANGYTYRIPASTSRYGSPRVATITSALASEAFSFADEGEPQPNVDITCSFYATQATQVSWEVLVDGSWETMNSAYYYYGDQRQGSAFVHCFTSVSSTFTFSGGDGSATVTNGNMGYLTPSYGPPTNQVANLEMRYVSTDTVGKISLGFVRLKIDNTAIGGGVRYSSTCQCTLEDRTGSWLVEALRTRVELTSRDVSRLYRLKLWGHRNQPEDTRIYRGAVGRELIKKAMTNEEDFSRLCQRVKSLLAENYTASKRFAEYKRLVRECFTRYWPDCPDHRVASQLRHVHET
jgi:hypothetical protein